MWTLLREAQSNKKSVEPFVYQFRGSGKAHGQINNTPHPYGDCAECTVHQFGR